MQIWTTFCPSKISWELTYIETKGDKPSSDWQKNRKLIEESLHLLKQSGIAGIRLVIYPAESTQDGQTFNWTAIETMLSLCQKEKLLVDLCIGPFQYPNFPGIYLPLQLLPIASVHDKDLDTNPTLASYGKTFLQKQMKQFATDKRIHGFHFANEWPDKQRVSGRQAIRIGISEKFMLEASTLLKNMTTKPIILNTNIDASDKSKLTNTFTNILTILGSQGCLGFDVYPSQETWRKTPFQKMYRIFESYHHSFTWSQKKFAPCEMSFVEVEAQPWGNGQSWYQLISKAPNPQKSVLSYSSDSLDKTFKNYIRNTHCKRISLWGSDFWLSSKKMGIDWPLAQIKSITE